MATPGTLPSTPNAVAGNTLADMFGSGLAQSVGINQMVADIYQAWLKLGITDAPPRDSPLANTVLTSLANGRSGWATVATPMIAPDAVSQCAFLSGVTSGPTVSVATFQLLPDMYTPFTLTGGDLLVWFVGIFSHATTGASVNIALKVDAAADVANTAAYMPSSGGFVTLSTMYRWTGLSAVAHDVSVRWMTPSGTATAVAVNRWMLVMERKR